MSSVRLNPTTQEKVRQVAAMKGMTISEVHRQAIDRYCDDEIANLKTSRYSDIVGIFDSDEGDLSTRHKEVFREILSRKYEATQSND